MRFILLILLILPKLMHAQTQFAYDAHLYYEHHKPDNQVVGSIILVHGFCGSTFSWRHNIPALLEANYEVLAVDVPPFGQSERNPQLNYSASAQAERVWALLDSLFHQPKNWVLVGHSMGGDIVSAMAVKRPKQTKKVVFVAGALRNGKGNDQKLMKSISRSKLVQGIGELAGKLYFFRFKRMRNLLRDAYQSEPDSAAVMGYLAPLKQKQSATCILAMMGQSEPIFPHGLHQIHCPILAIWGMRDTWVPLKHYRSKLENMSNVSLEVFDEEGHCPMETVPDLFNQALIQWLTQTP